MSKNLVELIRRHHARRRARPRSRCSRRRWTTHGEITDDDRRARGRALGAARGDGLRRLDLLRRPAAAARRAPRPRLHRHAPASPRPATRTSTRCEPGSASSSASAATTARSRSRRPSASASATPRPPSATATSIDAGPGVVERVLAGATRAGRRARAGAACSTEPVLHAARRLVGPAPRAGRAHAARRCSTRSRPPTSAAAAAPASRPATKWEFARAAAGDEKFIVANGDEGDPGSYIDKHLMERNPALLLEGMALAGYAVGARARLRPHALGVPALEARARGGRRRRRAPTGCSATTSSAAASPSTSRSSRAPAPTSSARRRRCSPACRGCAAPSRRGRRSPPSAACYGLPTVVNNVETLVQRPVHRARAAPRPTARSARARRPGTKLVCFNERFARPGVYEVPLRHAGARAVRGARRRPARRARDQGAADRRAARRDPARRRCSTRRSTSTPLAAEGCMVGHGGIVAFDDRTDMRDARRATCCTSAPHESCGKCFPCRIGLQRAHEMFADDGAGRPRAARGAAGDARARQPVRARRRHARADPQPARALPRRAGAGADAALTIDGAAVEVAAGDDGARGRARRRARRADALLRRAPGAVRRLPRLPRRRRGRARAARRRARRRCRDGMAIDTRDATARRVAARRRRARALRAARAARAAHRAGRGRRASSASASRAGRARRTTPRHDDAPSLPRLPARALHLVRALRARLRRGPGRRSR